MAGPKDEWTVQGFNVQSGTGVLTHTVSAIPHGSPHPADQRPGYMQPGQPGGHNAQTRVASIFSGNEESLQTVRGMPPTWIQAATITKVHGQNWAVFLGVQSSSALTFSITSGSLPTGVSLTTSGALAGKLAGNTSTSAGTTPLTFQATDALGQVASKAISLVLT